MKNNVYNIVTAKFEDNTNYKIIEIEKEDGMVYTQLINDNNFD